MENNLEEMSLDEKLAQASLPKPLAPSGNNGNGNNFPEKESKESKDFKKAEDITVYDFLKTFSGGPPIRIQLIRTAPTKWENENIEGLIDTFDEFLSEEEIKENYGGGKYKIVVQKDRGNGQYVYAGAKTFKIAGNPIVSKSSDKDDDVILPSASDDTVKAALTMAQTLTRDALDRADRERNERQPSGISETMLGLVTEPLKMQIQTLNSQLAEKDRIITEKDRLINELSTKKPDTLLQDTLIGKMIEGESSRIESIRMQHESERRQLMQGHADEIKRVQDRHDYDIKRLEDSHKRELQNLRDSIETRVESLKTGYEGRLEAKDNRIKDLERDLNKNLAELGELRAKKDKGLNETIADIVSLKENLSVLGMKDDDGPEESVFDKVTEMAAPLIKGIGARLEQGRNQQAPQQQQVVKRRVVRAVPKKEAQPSTSKELAPVQQTEGLSVDPGEIAAAVAFIETGLKNGTSPENFAQSIRNMVPTNVLNALKKEGVDTFLDGIAQPYIEIGSPLTTQVGRTFVRKVVKYLLTETTDLT